MHDAADPPRVSERDCPKRPATDDDLDFVRRPMVRWLDPHQLIDTAGRVLASGFSTSFTDSRQMQALVPTDIEDRSQHDDIWIDYVSDLGDGWNSTFTVASLLAQERLELSHQGELHRMERGALLVMGGDQVYPVPTRTEYHNRLLGPYRAAMPCAPPDASPELFAIPGSHDWYDGLVNFTNIFCRQRPVGGWTTSQTRSYFAIRLPHGWWLWGIDLQFGDYLDEPQLAYFRLVGKEMEPGDRIVLCMAKEVESGRKSAEVYVTRNLTDLEREVVQPAGARIALYLKSGRHYYARYAADDGDTQLVTAGGGGAFLHPTHDIPDVGSPPSEDAAPLRRTAVYPSAEWSRKLRKRVWLLPAYNLPLAGALGALQVLVVFMLTLHLDDSHRDLDFASLGRALWLSPSAFLVLIVVIVIFGAMIRLAHDASGFPRLLIGLGHSVLQFGGLAAVIVVASGLTSNLDNPWSLLAFLGLVWVFGGVGGVLGVSGYLWASNCLGYHGNEAYAPLHHMDQKNFLRLHIDAGGALSLYPIAIDRVGRRWTFEPDAAGHEPWLVPAGKAPQPHLIEAPVRLGRPEPPSGGNAAGDR